MEQCRRKFIILESTMSDAGVGVREEQEDAPKTDASTSAIPEKIQDSTGGIDLKNAGGDEINVRSAIPKRR